MELFVVAILLAFAGAQGSQLEGPQNTLSVVGSTVTLKCSSSSKNCNGIDWQKYVQGASISILTIFKGPRTFLNTNVTDRERYSVNNSSGCDLVIRNVQLKDAGRFICSAIMNSSQMTKSAYLIILESQPKCTVNTSLDDTVENDGVQLKCEVTYYGTNNASMVWKGVADASNAVNNGNTISRSYSVVASELEVPSFTCEALFSFEVLDNGKPIVVLATNSIPNVNCSTSAIKVIYSVRNVTLSPSLSNYPPGITITCAARGHPSPTFKWQEIDNCGTWMDIQNQFGSQFTMTNDSSKRYRCVAMNVVRGRSYNKTSRAMQFNNAEFEDNLSSAGPITSEYYIGVGIGIGLLIAILLAIAVHGILIGLGYLKFHSKTSTKLSDGVVRHQDHEMSPSSHQRSAILRTRVPLPGEQESTYASLGEDRDDNEYASLEQRQKAKPKKKSKP